MDFRPIHAQSLSTGDLRPKAILLGSGRKGNESVRGDVPSWAARDHRIGSSLLDVGQEPVVGVLIRRPNQQNYITTCNSRPGIYLDTYLTCYLAYSDKLFDIFSGIFLTQYLASYLTFCLTYFDN